MNAIEIVTQLVWPENKRADDRDRARAREVLTTAAADGRISVTESERRLQVLATATTRGELYRTLRGIDGAAPSEGLRTALRIVTSVWLLSSIVEFAVWLTMAVVSGTVDAPWWLYSVTVGGVIVGLVYLANEAAHRSPAALGSGALGAGGSAQGHRA